MSTNNSTATAYASSDDLIKRYDVRTVCELLSDTNTPVTASSLSSNTSLSALLLGSSGWLESACTVGNRYAITDLAGLAGASLEMLKDLVCGFTMFQLWSRRPARMAQMELPAMAGLAMDMLDKLREGERIFGILEVAQAGNNPTPYLMTTSDLITGRNPISQQARNFFGDRGENHAGGN